jgi:hypothetical protein
VKSKFLFATLAVFMGMGMWVFATGQAADSPVSGNALNPILIELFTSEGCSTCPPADQLLQKYDAQPIAGAQLIVLSEHVDYWNHDGWTDPYSSPAYTERQNHYGDRFHLKSVYTPQMVVDGVSQFVGNSFDDARAAFAKSQPQSMTAVRIRDVDVKDGKLRARVESDGLPAGAHKADVIFVVALNHAESQVARGENAGHRLSHVAVVRTMNVVGAAESGKPFNKDVSASIGRDIPAVNLRVVAFLQESGQGRVVGAAEVNLAQ